MIRDTIGVYNTTSAATSRIAGTQTAYGMRVQEKDLHARDLTYHFEEVSLYGFRDIHAVLCPVGWMRRVESAQVEIIRGGDEVGSVTSNNNTRASQHPLPSGHRRIHNRHPKQRMYRCRQIQ